jgi:hypothetical protein
MHGGLFLRPRSGKRALKTSVQFSSIFRMILSKRSSYSDELFSPMPLFRLPAVLRVVVPLMTLALGSAAMAASSDARPASLTTLKIEPGKLDIQFLQMLCWDAELKTKGLFAFSEKGYQFNGLLSLKRVQIKQFLEAFKNFNQTAIQSSQINGSIGLESDLEMHWDPEFNFNKQSFKHKESVCLGFKEI